jgi:phosphomannomutase/phosphoglucomutase
MGIFKAYDIRGVYGEDLNDEIAERLAKAYTTYMNADEVIVGNDSRMSSPALTSAVIAGVTGAGADVYSLGIVPGPLVSFQIAQEKKNAGIYVTASHNPPEYNGFKLMKGIISLDPDELLGIKKIMDGKHFKIGNGEVYHRDMINAYQDYVAAKFRLRGGLKIVMDSANGTCGLVAPGLFKKMDCYVTELYSQPNGKFPNHYPDPTRAENLTDIKRMVVQNASDFGVAYDGDGDRVVFIDEKGRDLSGDDALMLFARQILEKKKGKIIMTVGCSRAVEEDVKAHGGTPIINRVGHSFIKKRLFEEDALMAGELSGHFFFKDDYFGYDDAIYASMRMAQIMRETGKKLSELVAELPHYCTSAEERLPYPDEKKFRAVEGLKREFSDEKLITLDGVRIEFKNGWALVRASNTEPVLSLRFEGNAEKDMDEIRKRVYTALQKLGVA